MNANILDKLNKAMKEFIENCKKTSKSKDEKPIISTIKVPDIPVVDININAELNPIETQICKVCGKPMICEGIQQYQSKVIRKYICITPNCSNCNHIIIKEDN